LTVLASSAPAAGQVVTGVLGFLVVAGMGVALFFLLRSMNKQLRKVMREPRWREEAHEGQEARDGQEALPGQPEQDYSRNGSGQPG
jgi:large-conductance mechanosensitive channel